MYVLSLLLKLANTTVEHEYLMRKIATLFWIILLYLVSWLMTPRPFHCMMLLMFVGCTNNKNFLIYSSFTTQMNIKPQAHCINKSIHEHSCYYYVPVLFYIVFLRTRTCRYPPSFAILSMVPCTGMW